MKSKNAKATGLSIPQDLLEKTLARAKAEDRSFSYIVVRAIKRDLAENRVQPNETGDLVTAKELANSLHCSVDTVKRRSRNSEDPLFIAKSRIGGKGQTLFRVSKLNSLDRAA
jgi:DNA invertase Pin-like site-specific DNA recombinase